MFGKRGESVFDAMKEAKITFQISNNNFTQTLPSDLSSYLVNSQCAPLPKDLMEKDQISEKIYPFQDPIQKFPEEFATHLISKQLDNFSIYEKEKLNSQVTNPNMNNILSFSLSEKKEKSNFNGINSFLSSLREIGLKNCKSLNEKSNKHVFLNLVRMNFEEVKLLEEILNQNAKSRTKTTIVRLRLDLQGLTEFQFETSKTTKEEAIRIISPAIQNTIEQITQFGKNEGLIIIFEELNVSQTSTSLRSLQCNQLQHTLTHLNLSKTWLSLNSLQHFHFFSSLKNLFLDDTHFNSQDPKEIHSAFAPLKSNPLRTLSLLSILRCGSEIVKEWIDLISFSYKVQVVFVSQVDVPNNVLLGFWNGLFVLKQDAVYRNFDIHPPSTIDMGAPRAKADCIMLFKEEGEWGAMICDFQRKPIKWCTVLHLNCGTWFNFSTLNELFGCSFTDLKYQGHIQVKNLPNLKPQIPHSEIEEQFKTSKLLEMKCCGCGSQFTKEELVVCNVLGILPSRANYYSSVSNLFYCKKK